MSVRRPPVGRVPSPGVPVPLRGSAPTGRKKLATGRASSRRSGTKADALGQEFQNTPSPEGAKEGAWPIVPLREVVEIKPRPSNDELGDDSLASFIPMRCVEEGSGRFEPLGDRKVAEVRKGY